MLHYSEAYIVKVIQYAIYISRLKIIYTHTHARTHARNNTHTHPFNGPFSGTTQMSSYQKGKPIWILLKQETVSGSGISWAICKSAPCYRQTTTPAPHTLFLQAGCLSCHPTKGVKALKANLNVIYLQVIVRTHTHTRTALPGPLEYRLCRLSCWLWKLTHVWTTSRRNRPDIRPLLRRVAIVRRIMRLGRRLLTH